MKTVTEYWIFKKTKGVAYPGESWDGPFTKRATQKKFNESYANWDHQIGGKKTLSKQQDFRIVKTTHQAVTK